MVSEAHLPVQRRALPLVRWVPRPKIKWGWSLFLTFAVVGLNEVRGAYVVAEILKAWTQA